MGPITRQLARGAPVAGDAVKHAPEVAKNAATHLGKRNRPEKSASMVSSTRRCRSRLQNKHKQHQHQHQQQQENPPSRWQTKRRKSVVDLFKRLPIDPTGHHQHIPEVLQAFVQSDPQSSFCESALTAVIEIAAAAPGLLMQALQGGPQLLQPFLQQLLHVMNLRNQQQRKAILMLSALARDAAKSGPAAAGAVIDVLAQHPSSLQKLLNSIDLSIDNDSDASVSHSAVSVIVRLAATNELHPGPLSIAVTRRWFDAVIMQQQHGLRVLLQSMHQPATATAAALALMAFAAAAPDQLLHLLLQQRRALHSLMSALDSSCRTALTLTSAAVQRMIAVADQQQLKLLLQHLLQAVQHNSMEAAGLVFSISVEPAGLPLLVQHVKVLLQLLRSPGPFQPYAGNVLWRLSQLPDGARVLIQSGLPQLMQAILHGEEDTQIAGAVVAGVLASTDEGLQAFAAHIPELLAATQPSHRTEITAQAMRIILVLTSRGGSAVQRAVLLHTDAVLAVMLQQHHTDAARDAGSTVLLLLQLQQGLLLLAQERNVDKLLQVVQQRGSGTFHASRALALIAAAVPSCRELLLAPQRQAVLHGIVDLVPAVIQIGEVESAEGCDAFGPVFWATAAAAACGIVPEYVPQLVAVLCEHARLSMPFYDALMQLLTFQDGLLALAPHMQRVGAAVEQRITESNSYISDACALRATHAAACLRVNAAVQQLQQEQAVAQARMQHAALQLAAAYGHHKRWPYEQKLAAGFLLWLQHFGAMNEQNTELQRQLAAAGGGPA